MTNTRSIISSSPAILMIAILILVLVAAIIGSLSGCRTESMSEKPGIDCYKECPPPIPCWQDPDQECPPCTFEYALRENPRRATHLLYKLVSLRQQGNRDQYLTHFKASDGFCALRMEYYVGPEWIGESASELESQPPCDIGQAMLDNPHMVEYLGYFLPKIFSWIESWDMPNLERHVGFWTRKTEKGCELTLRVLPATRQEWAVVDGWCTLEKAVKGWPDKYQEDLRGVVKLLTNPNTLVGSTVGVRPKLDVGCKTTLRVQPPTFHPDPTLGRHKKLKEHLPCNVEQGVHELTEDERKHLHGQLVDTLQENVGIHPVTLAAGPNRDEAGNCEVRVRVLESFHLPWIVDDFQELCDGWLLLVDQPDLVLYEASSAASKLISNFHIGYYRGEDVLNKAVLFSRIQRSNPSAEDYGECQMDHLVYH